MIALFFFGLKLGFKMAYRLGMLWILIPTAPVALACWAIPQTRLLAATWTRLFVGWTFGQVLVTIALKLGFVVGPFGPAGASVGGLIFSVAMFALASHAADLLVHGTGPRVDGSAGVRAVMTVATAARSAIMAAHSRAGATASLQQRLPGF